MLKAILWFFYFKKDDKNVTTFILIFVIFDHCIIEGKRDEI